jgi:predicted aspartyl protease
MGTTRLKVRVSNPKDRRRFADEELLVDSGWIYAVVPASVLRGLGIEPEGKETFTLADGSHVDREIGNAIFEIDGRKRASPVIFGRRGDACLMGALTLEALGLMLDPLKRRLRPLPMPHGPCSFANRSAQ